MNQLQAFQNQNGMITSQIRRCSISISSNIAEGAGRSVNRDFTRFLHIAYGSSYELEIQLIISKNLSFLEQPGLDKLINSLIEIQKMLYSFIKKLEEN